MAEHKGKIAGRVAAGLSVAALSLALVVPATMNAASFNGKRECDANGNNCKFIVVKAASEAENEQEARQRIDQSNTGTATATHTQTQTPTQTATAPATNTSTIDDSTADARIRNTTGAATATGHSATMTVSPTQSATGGAGGYAESNVFTGNADAIVDSRGNNTGHFVDASANAAGGDDNGNQTASGTATGGAGGALNANGGAGGDNTLTATATNSGAGGAGGDNSARAVSGRNRADGSVFSDTGDATASTDGADGGKKRVSYLGKTGYDKKGHAGDATANTGKNETEGEVDIETGKSIAVAKGANGGDTEAEANANRNDLISKGGDGGKFNSSEGGDAKQVSANVQLGVAHGNAKAVNNSRPNVSGDVGNNGTAIGGITGQNESRAEANGGDAKNVLVVRNEQKGDITAKSGEAKNYGDATAKTVNVVKQEAKPEVKQAQIAVQKGEAEAKVSQENEAKQRSTQKAEAKSSSDADAHVKKVEVKKFEVKKEYGDGKK